MIVDVSHSAYNITRSNCYMYYYIGLEMNNNIVITYKGY